MINNQVVALSLVKAMHNQGYISDIAYSNILRENKINLAVYSSPCYNRHIMRSVKGDEVERKKD